MNWLETPSSSAVAYIGYDLDRRILGVIWRGNPPRAYEYLAVPPGVWDALLAAPSIGAYLNREVKPKYITRPIPLP